MAQYYTDQDRIDAQTMRIDVSLKIHADPCNHAMPGPLSDVVTVVAESQYCGFRIHSVSASTTIREAGADATPNSSGKDI